MSSRGEDGLKQSAPPVSETVENELLSRADAWGKESIRSEESSLQDQMGKVFGFLKGYHATYVLSVGRNLGLFEAIHASGGGVQPNRLADQLGLNRRYVQLWCETACSLELLDYDPKSGFGFAPEMDRLLGDTSSPFFVGSFPDVHRNVGRDYEDYPERFRTGKVVPYQDHDLQMLESVALATVSLPRMFIELVLPKLPGLRARLEEGCRLLDMGCGGGSAIVEFARQFPSVECTGVDLETKSIELAKDLIRESDLSERVRAVLVDGAELPAEMEAQFDVVTSFLVLHEIHPEKKDAVLSHCARALRPGGELLLFDEQYPGAPSEIRDQNLSFSVIAQWFEMTWGNVVNTKPEIHAMLRKSGFEIVEETNLSRFYVVVAKKVA